MVSGMDRALGQFTLKQEAAWECGHADTQVIPMPRVSLFQHRVALESKVEEETILKPVHSLGSTKPVGGTSAVCDLSLIRKLELQLPVHSSIPVHLHTISVCVSGL